MLMQSISGQMREFVARFTGDRRGNVAVMFAVALVPLLGFVGAAVDYSRANAARSSMQVALDSAALMVSKDVSANPSMSASDITAKATAYFNALYTNPNAGAITLTATYTTNVSTGSTVTLTGDGTVTTDFMKMVGYPQLGIGTVSTTTWGSTRMRVAMVLDVTGSMKDNNKMTEMQKAAGNLVDTLQSTARTAADVYISIVPFALTVNVGTSNKNASWLKWTEYGSCSSSAGSSGAPGVASADSYPTKTLCQLNGYSWKASNKTSGWTGCVTDRDQPYDTQNNAPSSTATSFPAIQDSACPPQLMPMTSAYAADDVTTIKTKINALTPQGGTNQAIGLAWGWQTLQLGDPLNTPVKDSNYKYTDAIILLSDGLNTFDRWYGDGVHSSTASQVNDRQKVLCQNIKDTSTTAAPVVIYTIQVNTTGEAESAVLKECATSGNFFSTTTASGIQAAFTAIGNSLNQLRVSR